MGKSRKRKLQKRESKTTEARLPESSQPVVESPPYYRPEGLTSRERCDDESWRGVVLLTALETAMETGMIEKADPRELLLKIGINPDKAEAARPEMRRFMEEMGGYEGRYRPRQPPEPKLNPETLRKVLRASRDYIIEHPGCADASGPRAFYSKGYKAFVLSLLGPGGLAEGATRPEAELVAGVPWATLSAWMRQARLSAASAEATDETADR